MTRMTRQCPFFTVLHISTKQTRSPYQIRSFLQTNRLISLNADVTVYVQVNIEPQTPFFRAVVVERYARLSFCL